MNTSIVIDKLARKIAKLTDINNHNESVMVLAKFLEDKEAIEKMEVLKEKHEAAGYMETEWIKERYDICTGLLNKVIFLYGEEAKKKLNSSF